MAMRMAAAYLIELGHAMTATPIPMLSRPCRMSPPRPISLSTSREAISASTPVSTKSRPMSQTMAVEAAPTQKISTRPNPRLITPRSSRKPHTEPFRCVVTASAACAKPVTRKSTPRITPTTWAVRPGHSRRKRPAARLMNPML